MLINGKTATSLYYNLNLLFCNLLGIGVNTMKRYTPFSKITTTQIFFCFFQITKTLMLRSRQNIPWNFKLKHKASKANPLNPKQA